MPSPRLIMQWVHTMNKGKYNAPWGLVTLDPTAEAIGYRAIVDADMQTICAPSPMGEDAARLIVFAPRMLSLLQDIAFSPQMTMFDMAGAARELLLELDPSADVVQADMPPIQEGEIDYSDIDKAASILLPTTNTGRRESDA